MLDKKFDKKINNDNEPSATRRLSVSALFEQSGEIAAVDLRRFGMRAGEIIARGARRARAAGKSHRVRKIA